MIRIPLILSKLVSYMSFPHLVSHIPHPVSHLTRRFSYILQKNEVIHLRQHAHRSSNRKRKKGFNLCHRAQQNFILSTHPASKSKHKTATTQRPQLKFHKKKTRLISQNSTKTKLFLYLGRLRASSL